MNYANIKFYDIADGPGVRVSLFVSGCTNHCDQCFQPETWDFAYGNPYTPEVEDSIIEALRAPYVTGLTLLGGEPFEPQNQPTVLALVERVRRELPEKTVWSFSGFTYEEMTIGRLSAYPTTAKLLDQLDVLVDGRFVEKLKDISLLFRGSSNQRLIDMKKTRACGEVVLWAPDAEGEKK